MIYWLDRRNTKYEYYILKTKIFFVGVNENSTTFLYTLNRGDKKTEGEKEGFFFKVYNKVQCY